MYEGNVHEKTQKEKKLSEHSEDTATRLYRASVGVVLQLRRGWCTGEGVVLSISAPIRNG